ncbi:hypothetical protein BKI52_27825 [marine bacterium AO1-C]|nr:hypothetical protein BKI52_27825 [marine bacterium AO1-C]
MTMIKIDTSDILYLKYLHFSRYNQVKHFVTTRVGGVSQNPGKGLNMGFHAHDQDSNVIRNREILARSLDISVDSFCFLNQVHGDQVAVVDHTARGRGVKDSQNTIPKTDAIITQSRDVCLIVLSADCVGVLFYDPVKQVIGAAHSGWRGTVKKIAAKTVEAMQANYGSRPQDILVGLGPGISPEVYEVGSEVVEEVEKAYGSIFQYVAYPNYTQKPHFNIWEAIRQSLIDTGVSAKNIITSGLCSYRNPSLFFSHRRDEGKTGRFATGIMLA